MTAGRKKTLTLISCGLWIPLIFCLLFCNDFEPAYGKQIPFNRTAWHKNKNNARYYMTEDLKERLTEKNISREDVISILGKPWYENNSLLCYYLKPDEMVGLGYSELVIELDGNHNVVNVKVEHPD